MCFILGLSKMELPISRLQLLHLALVGDIEARGLSITISGLVETGMSSYSVSLIMQIFVSYAAARIDSSAHATSIHSTEYVRVRSTK
jgi:hypothetical protein